MLLEANKSYTFSEIFELNASTDAVLAELGYDYRTQKLDLARYPLDKDAVSQLQAKFYRRLPRISFTSEIARREFIISDILGELLDYAPFQIEVEFATSTKQLRGQIDYLLRGEQSVVVVEAKNDEMERGFRQLAVELIATAEQLSLNQLYGAVTTGEIWRFGWLDMDERRIVRDLDLFSVPTGLQDLMETLAGLTSTDS